MNKTELINKLLQVNTENIHATLELSRLSSEILEKRPALNKWNAMECVEHLLKYGDYYIPEIDKQLRAAQPSSTNEYKSSWLGNYFAEAVSPLEGNKKAKKMNTLKKTNTLNSTIRPEAITEFLKQQEDLQKQLEKSRNYNIQKIKTGTSITPLIRLRLGDTFRVIIMHNKRHLIQAKRAAGLIS